MYMYLIPQGPGAGLATRPGVVEGGPAPGLVTVCQGQKDVHVLDTTGSGGRARRPAAGSIEDGPAPGLVRGRKINYIQA